MSSALQRFFNVRRDEGAPLMAAALYFFFVLTALMHTGPIEGTRFVDVSENALYWYFVVMSWLPIYAVIYLVPRLT